MKVPLKNIGEEDIVQGILKAIEGLEFSSVTFGVSASEQLKMEQRKKVSDFMVSLGKKVLLDGGDLYLLVNLERGFIESIAQPVYVKGSYNKFSRSVAQTFHYCFRCRGTGCKNCNGTGKLSEHSVQEICERSFIPAFNATESRFHGCGREDVDVRMLGKGRPFILELVEPKKRSADLEKLENEINSKNPEMVTVHNLSFCKKEDVAALKNTEFAKIYRARCVCKGNVSKENVLGLSGMEIEIVQRTPERVEKRRSDIERPKSAKIVAVNFISENEFEADILSSHGLYIKEFVSGDNGRTVPSISSLLGKGCVCKELDVLEIVLNENQK